jgi:hypothetical protein
LGKLQRLLILELLLLLSAAVADAVPRHVFPLLLGSADAGRLQKWLYILWDNGSHATIAAVLWLACAAALGDDAPTSATPSSTRLIRFLRSGFYHRQFDSCIQSLPAVTTLKEALLAAASASAMDADHFLSARALSLTAATTLEHRSFGHSAWIPAVCTVLPRYDFKCAH